MLTHSSFGTTQKHYILRAKLLDSVIYCCRLRGITEAVPLENQRRLRR